MSDLIVIVCQTVSRAEEVRQRLADLQTEYLVALDDAVIATRTDAGEIRVDKQLKRTAEGAIACGFWGLLIGALFRDPAGSTSAATSAVATALNAVGLNDTFVKKLTTSLKPGNSALFLLIKIMAPDVVLKEIRRVGGVMLKTSLDETKEQVLREALQRAVTAEAARPNH